MLRGLCDGKRYDTSFAGGDDLVMVGPWDVMVAFAGHMRDLFHKAFGDRGLTLSAGLALFKPKRPIKTAVAEAERLLEQAKTQPAPGAKTAKDQCAAFGQVWKWQEHPMIVHSADQLRDWVESGQMERGWLQTLLELALTRHACPPDLLATARLAHHVLRNYRRGPEARDWAERVVANLDELSGPEVRYLPAIARAS